MKGSRQVPGALFALLLWCGGCMTAQAQAEFVYDGRAGFVVSHIEYALGPDASDAGTCPEGMTSGYDNPGEVFVGRPDLARAEDEEEGSYIRRAFSVLTSDPDVKNLCLNPELGAPDPRFKTVARSDVAADGLDRDQFQSTADGALAPGTCAHSDFAGGVDNQFYRVVGCSNSFQSTGQSNTFAIEMLTGSWGVLITLEGLDDIRNDDEVTVNFYANNDPIELSPAREPLPWSTYAIERDPRYQSTTRGRLVDGVLVTEPVDLRMHWVVNSMRVDRPLDNAIARLTLSSDGMLEGYLAGYADVEELYSMMYGYRTATDGTGELATLRLRAGSSIGKAFVQNHTCEGAYHALWQHADAEPDPETGRCTAISMQFRIEAIPAFVVDVETQGMNDELDQAGHRRDSGNY